jgi:hypothetical protein
MLLKTKEEKIMSEKWNWTQDDLIKVAKVLKRIFDADDPKSKAAEIRADLESPAPKLKSPLWVFWYYPDKWDRSKIPYTPDTSGKYAQTAEEYVPNIISPECAEWVVNEIKKWKS